MMSQKAEVQEPAVPSSPLRRSMRLRNAVVTPEYSNSLPQRNSTEVKTPSRGAKSRKLSPVDEKDVPSDVQNEKKNDVFDDKLPQIEEVNEIEEPQIDGTCSKNSSEKDVNDNEDMKEGNEREDVVDPDSENCSSVANTTKRVVNLKKKFLLAMYNSDDKEKATTNEIMNKNEEIINLVKQNNIEEDTTVSRNENISPEEIIQNSAQFIENIKENYIPLEEGTTHLCKETKNETDKEENVIAASRISSGDSKIEIILNESGFKDVIQEDDGDKITEKNEPVKDEENQHSDLELKTYNISHKKDNVDVICTKIDELLSKTISSSESDSEHEQNHFLDTMAEEGEEDTPSEGSNDIVEVGEEINTTESDISTDKSYDKDSFIDDEENCQLLSGQEYDLSFENSPKRRRIIELSSGSDEEIVQIERKATKIEKKRKKSRIIKFEDSSDEEIVQMERKALKIEKKQKESRIIAFENSSDEGVATKIEKKSDSDVLKARSDIAQPVTENENIAENQPSFNQDTQGDSNENLKGEEKVLLQHSATSIRADICLDEDVQEVVVVDDDTDKEITDDWPSQPKTLEVTSSSVNINKKVLILENIKVQDICDQELSLHINNVVKSLFSEMNRSSEMSVNLSLDYSTESLHRNTFPNRSTDSEMQKLDDTKKNKKNKLSKSLVNNKTENIFPPTKEKKQMKKKKKKLRRITNTNRPMEEKELNELKNQNISNNTDLNKQNRKRKHPASETPLPPNPSKKRKRKKKKSTQVKDFAPENTELSLVAEAILIDKRKRTTPAILGEPLDEEWDIQAISVNPSRTSDSQNKIPKVKAMKCSRSENVTKPEFHAKDFRNLMLYDNRRIKRMGTQQLLKKKI